MASGPVNSLNQRFRSWVFRCWSVPCRGLPCWALAAGLIAAPACQKKPADREQPPPVRETAPLPLQDPDARQIRFTQISRKSLTQKMVVPPESVFSDVFRQQEILPPVIDILIVIDNSYSMEEEQANLADKLTALLSDLNEVDWRINVITTDNTCRRLPELPLKPDTPDMLAVFQNAVRAGINGSGSETGLQNTIDHLRRGCPTDPPWRRDGKDFAVLVVSDEDEDMYSPYSEKPDLFIKDMEAIGFTPGKNFKFYGIIGHPEAHCPDVATPGATYAEVIKGTEGLWGSICASDYTQTLSAISRDMRTNLKVEFPLRFAPVLSTIRLDLDGSAYSGDWTLIGQSLVLADSLPEGATLTVKYQVESFRLLKLGVKTGEYVLESIRVNGRLLDATQFSYDPVENTILLTFDPEGGTEIQTTLTENKQLLSSFDFPEGVPETIACYMGDERLTATLSVENGRISFDPPPPAGSTVTCLYQM